MTADVQNLNEPVAPKTYDGAREFVTLMSRKQTWQTKGKRAAAPVCLAAVLWIQAGQTHAAPREMSDAEMDNVHGKSGTVDAMTMTQIANMVMDFTHRSAAQTVSGSVSLLVESSTTDPARVQVMIGSQPVSVSTPVTRGALDTIHIRASEAAVRVIGDVNLSVIRNSALPAAAASLLQRYGR